MSLDKPYPMIARGEEFPTDYLLNAIATQNILSSYLMIKRDLLRIFGFLEPSRGNLKSYSHENYNLLLRACTEFETLAKMILKHNKYSIDKTDINDYRRLEGAMKLSDYTLELSGYEIPILIPFARFSPSVKSPVTRTPEWYSAYTDVKHDRIGKFHQASLENVITSCSAIYVLISASLGFHFDYETSYRETRFNLDVGGTNVEGDTISIDKITLPFKTLTFPKWEAIERYSFDWQTLKLQSEPYIFHPLMEIPW